MTATPLENPEESPCFGCGPRHARGLRLSFEREGDAVRCTYVPKEDEVGWPGLFHTGLHYTVVFETMYWCALEATGRVHAVHGPQTFDQARLPRVGKPFTVTARVVGQDPLRVRAQSAMEGGKPCATAEATFQPVTRAQVERAGLKLPDYLLHEMDP